MESILSKMKRGEEAVQGIFLGNGVRIEWVSAELNICGLCQSETNTRDGPNASGVRGLMEEVWSCAAFCVTLTPLGCACAETHLMVFNLYCDWGSPHTAQHLQQLTAWSSG